MQHAPDRRPGALRSATQRRFGFFAVICMIRRVNRLQAYILRQLAGPAVFFLLTLTGIIWITQSLRFVDLIVNKGLSASYFLYLTMLVLPGVLAAILPVALFAAVLHTYQRLHADSELVVMRSAGLSNLALIRPALMLAALVTVLGYLMTLYLMPAGQREFKEMKTSLRTNLSYVMLQEGRFNTIGDKLTVYLRARTSSGELRGILVHDNRNPAKPVTMMAEAGALIRTDEGPRFVLAKGNRQEVDHRGGQLSLLQFDEYTLDLNQFIEKVEARWLEPRERYLHELFWPDGSPDDIANSDKLWAEAHDRLTMPLYAPVFVLIALAFVLSGQNRRRSRAWRVIAAVATVVAVRAAGLGFTALTAKWPILAPLMYLYIVIMCAGSIYILVRKPRGSALPSANELSGAA
jgi:lipopolysaccharide export system permease protein